ncbi:MAG TPA: hypothetical protein DEA78_10350, partial [Cyanobacteria bacterium UBA11159]|nr:hypothetical protein [Cyanobacteria bacterium UBA11159]
TSPSEIDNLVCYMETEDGQIVNLESLCKKTENNNLDKSANQPKCFLVDGNGNPCPSSSPQAKSENGNL